MPRHPPCALKNLATKDYKDARVHCVVLNIRAAATGNHPPPTPTPWSGMTSTGKPDQKAPPNQQHEMFPSPTTGSGRSFRTQQRARPLPTPDQPRSHPTHPKASTPPESRAPIRRRGKGVLGADRSRQKPCRCSTRERPPHDIRVGNGAWTPHHHPHHTGGKQLHDGQPDAP